MLLILAAVPLETDLLRQKLLNTERRPHRLGLRFFGSLGGRPVVLAHGGIGPVNMAHHLTALLIEQQPRAVLLCGCGGSFPGHGLRNGDLAVASSETHGDLGVVTADGFIPLESLNIPQDKELLSETEQTFRLDDRLLDQARRALPGTPAGPFVSVTCGSGTPQASRQLQQRTGAICENMEGAAAAQVCAAYKVPLLELRGISNPTGTRDPRQWELKKAARTAQEGLLKILESWPDPS